jgi:hypothetical protein
MFFSIGEFLYWSIRHTVSECRLLHVTLSALNRIGANAACVINVTNVVWIGQMIITHDAGCPRLDAYRIGHFVHPFDWSWHRREVAVSDRLRIHAELVDSSLAEVVLEAPEHSSRLLLVRKWWRYISFILGDIAMLVTNSLPGCTVVGVWSIINMCPNGRMHCINLCILAISFFLAVIFFQRVKKWVAMWFMNKRK